MSGKALRIGIVGMGMVGDGNAKRLLQGDIAGAELGAISEIDPQRLQAAKDEFGVDGYTDHRELCARDDIDLIYVATPQFAHAQPAIDALEAGKHVFLQKPVAHTWEETVRVYDVARTAEAQLRVGLQLPYTLGYKRVKQLIDEGYTGELKTLTLCHWQGVWPNPYRQDGKLCGGIVVECGCHYVGVMLWFAGSRVKRLISASPPNTIAAYKNMRDSIHTNMWLENGAVVRTTFAHTLGGGGRVGCGFGFRLAGTHGSISCDLHTQKMSLIKHNVDASGMIVGFEEDRIEDYSNIDWHIYRHDGRSALQAFVNHIREGKPPLDDADDILHLMRVCFAIEESAVDGEIKVLD